MPSLAPSALPTGHAGVDRCPGALAVHQALDGGLARIRIPGGALPSPVLAALGDWAAELGNGRLELTGRGNLQLRGLRPGGEVELADRQAGHGLLPSPAHDKARNVLASPLSGRDGLGAWDVRPLVGALDRGLCGSAELAELPGRFLFALDDGRGDVAGLGADAVLLARPGERAALLLAGRDTGLRPPAAEAVDALLAVAREFLRVRDDERVWRVAELPGGPLSLVGRSSPGPLDAPRRALHGPVGRFPQADGRVALGVGVPLGELEPRLCRLLAGCAGGEVVLTPWRGVLLPDLDEAAARDAAGRLAGAGLLLDPGAPLLAVSACTGRPGCGKALADVRADARAHVPAGQGRPVHWSGCARRCGRPSDAVDIVAEAGGYRVLDGGLAVGAGLGPAAAAARHVPGGAESGPAEPPPPDEPAGADAPSAPGAGGTSGGPGATDPERRRR